MMGDRKKKEKETEWAEFNGTRGQEINNYVDSISCWIWSNPWFILQRDNIQLEEALEQVAQLVGRYMAKGFKDRWTKQ